MKDKRILIAHNNQDDPNEEDSDEQTIELVEMIINKDKEK